MTEASGQSRYENAFVDKFRPNWVFWLFYRTNIHYIFIALLITASIFLLGLLFSIALKVATPYMANGTLYLNLLGIAIALIAFGWFTRKLPALLTRLSIVFDMSDQTYEQSYDGIVDKWATKVANRKLWILLATIFFAIPNAIETFDYWKSPSPPILLVPWVNSEASLFFAIFYGFLHIILVPFILGSGTVGMIGVVLLLSDLFQKPLKLAYYRYTDVVIELTAWLLMWALIGLASVLILGRQSILSMFIIEKSFALFPMDILSANINALIQSTLATIIIFGIGTIPLFAVGSAIEKAKNRELKPLERLYEKTNRELLTSLDKGTGKTIKELREKVVIIEEQMNSIKKIPTLPIRWPSIARISFGAIISAFSPSIKEWILNRTLNI